MNSLFWPSGAGSLDWQIGRECCVGAISMTSNSGPHTVTAFNLRLKRVSFHVWTQNIFCVTCSLPETAATVLKNGGVAKEKEPLQFRPLSCFLAFTVFSLPSSMNVVRPQAAYGKKAIVWNKRRRAHLKSKWVVVVAPLYIINRIQSKASYYMTLFQQAKHVWKRGRVLCAHVL